MVCSFQNETADLLYEALDKIDFLKDKIIRVYSRKSIENHKQDEPFMKNSYHKIIEERENEELKSLILKKKLTKSTLSRKEKQKIEQ